MLNFLSAERRRDEVISRLAVEVHRKIAKGTAELDVTLHVVLYGKDQTSDGRDYTASAEKSVLSLKHEFSARRTHKMTSPKILLVPIFCIELM